MGIPRLVYYAAPFALLSSASNAQSASPAKLVITWPQGGVTVIDYPTTGRCERAQDAVEREAIARKYRSQQNAPAGTVVVGGPWVVYAFCIPG